MMIERANSRLNAIFALWFLVAGIFPACIVGSLGYYFQRQAIILSAQRELGLFSSVKASQIRRYLDERQKIAEAIALQTEARESGLTSPKALDQALAGVVRDQSGLASRGIIYGISSSGSLQTQYQLSTNESDLWVPQPTDLQSAVHFSKDSVFIGRRVDTGNQWIVIRYPIQDIDEFLAEGVSDQAFALQGVGSDAAIDTDRLAKHADIFLTDTTGVLITQPFDLGIPDQGAATVPLSAWLEQSRPNNGIIAQTTFAGHTVMIHISPVSIAGSPQYLVTMVDRNEIIGRLKEQERLQLLTYIGSLILMLGILYIFVGLISRILVKPIFKTITDITSSTGAIQSGIATAEATMISQEAVATSLLTNYKDQLKNMKAVDTDGTKIADSLADIRKLTAKAAASVQLIDALAVKGQRDAEEARTSIASIKKLATAHEGLITTLGRYSEQVDSIAADVRSLAQATTYASLNATIEASSTDRGMHSVSSLASEVGKLSLLSREASEHINELVKSIQQQLLRSKEASSRERSEAVDSLTVITRALESLNKMSKDAMQIALSVQAIDKQVAKQSESTSQIALRMTDLHTQAKSTLREATRIQAVSVEQKKGIKTNSTAVSKLSVIVQRLGSLIGSRK